MSFQFEPGPPQPGEYIEYFGTYIQLAHEEQNLAGVLQQQIEDLRGLIGSADPNQLTTLHDPYTWTITQAVGHLVDSERIFGNRAGRFASGDETPLPGFDQNVACEDGGYDRCNMSDVFTEFEHLRQANTLMFGRLNEQQWLRQGTADGKPISVRAIAYLLVGHLRYHLEIFEKRLAKNGS